jgi:hypothetical protein
LLVRRSWCSRILREHGDDDQHNNAERHGERELLIGIDPDAAENILVIVWRLQDNQLVVEVSVDPSKGHVGAPDPAPRIDTDRCGRD